jgi:hypothetical protein
VSIPAEEAFAVALSDACEDFYGLYELSWEFNGRFTAANEVERLAAAQAAVMRLVREGLATIFRTRWMTEVYDELGAEAAAQLLADPASWRSPADSPDASYYCFTSTPAGDACYFRRPTAPPPAG